MEKHTTSGFWFLSCMPCLGENGGSHRIDDHDLIPEPVVRVTCVTVLGPVCLHVRIHVVPQAQIGTWLFLSNVN